MILLVIYTLLKTRGTGCLLQNQFVDIVALPKLEGISSPELPSLLCFTTVNSRCQRISIALSH